MIRNTSGASPVEYAIVAALIALTCIMAAEILSGWFERTLCLHLQEDARTLAKRLLFKEAGL